MRLLVQHFRVDHVSDVFHQFRVQCTAFVVEMVNLKTEKSLRDRKFRARQQQQIPEPNWPLGGERKAEKTDSAGNKIIALLEEPLLPIFDCENCGGTHKSLNCKSKCRLCKSKGLDDDHIQFHCPKIINAADKKKSQLPRTATGSPKRYLSLPIVIGSMICMHTLKLHHVSTTTNTNPVTRFWKMPTTFLLLLFLQLSVAPTPLRHVYGQSDDIRTSNCTP